jgi:SAM-dependent methyltransferase
MSATQFSLMFQCGLREHHSVLDFGAGSLRAGRLLIPYLRPGCYFAIEPNEWLIDDGVLRELGQDAVDLKRPSFSSDDGFDCTVFGRKFDFIMAQSIVTHCGPNCFRRLIGSMALALEDDGLVMFSYCNSPTPVEDATLNDWAYPECVTYSEDQVHGFLLDAGLIGRPIPWFHPGANWFLAALSPERLPTDREALLLNGAVLHDRQFAQSRL